LYIHKLVTALLYGTKRRFIYFSGQEPCDACIKSIDKIIQENGKESCQQGGQEVSHEDGQKGGQEDSQEDGQEDGQENGQEPTGL